MNREFVPHNVSIEMKELGFDEPCIAVRHRDGTLCSIVPEFTRDSQVEGFGVIRNSECLWENDEDSINGIQEVATLTFSQAFRWFREKHKIYHYVLREIGMNTSDVFFVACYYKGKKGNSPTNTCTPQSTFEEAELACLKKLIEIVKNKQQ